MAQGSQTFAARSAALATVFALDSTDVRALLEEFLIERRSDRECSPKTITWYRATLDNFIRYLRESNSPLEIADIQTRHIRGYRMFLQQPVRFPSDYRPNRASKPLSDAMRATYDRVLRVFFGWAVSAGYIDVSPVAALPKPKIHRKPMRFLSTQELEALWKSFEPGTRRGERDRTMFLLLLDTGVRASELTAIDINRVNLTAQTIEILGKGGHTRIVGMSDQTLQQVMRYAKRWRQKCSIPQLLLNPLKKQPVTYNSIQKIMLRWQEQAGIEKAFSCHSFRRTSATRAVQAGANAFTLAAMLGHTDLTMTKRYVQEAGLDLANLQANHSPLRGLKL